MSAEFFNDSAALFPILLLTKTVSSRNRTHEEKEIFLHLIHGIAVAAGTAIALWGALAPNPILAWLVGVFLAGAAITLASDLRIAYQKQGVDAKPAQSQSSNNADPPT